MPSIRPSSYTEPARFSRLQISQDRAEWMLTALVAQGVPRASLSAMGVGAKEPLFDEVTDEDRALNRRVSLRVNLTGLAKR